MGSWTSGPWTCLATPAYGPGWGPMDQPKPTNFMRLDQASPLGLCHRSLKY